MLNIDKKYVRIISRLEKINGKPLYHIEFNKKAVKGLHIFFHKIYFSLYVRLGKRR